MRLYELIVESARAGVRLQRDDGSFPGGQNGPYRDPETPVRNTAHWLITLLKAFQISGDVGLREAARAAGDYLTSDSCRPLGATFLCRTNPDKDFSNGLVGQAWVIEALVAGGEQLRKPAWLDLAGDVFRLHPFDREVGLWRVVNVDGSHRSYDLTFNHQLWFAACGSLIPKVHSLAITEQVTTFLERAASAHLRRGSRRGRIAHDLRGIGWSYELWRKSKFLRHPHHSRQAQRIMRSKEIGYHAFNLYALALLKQRIPHHGVWRSGLLRRPLQYVRTRQFLDGLDSSEFAYSYNPTGFEVAFAGEVLDPEGEGSHERRRWWIERQLARTYNRRDGLLSAGTTDPATLAARLYQATRLTDVTLKAI